MERVRHRESETETERQTDKVTIDGLVYSC